MRPDVQCPHAEDVVLLILLPEELRRRRCFRKRGVRNEELDAAPEQVNADPYGAGWIFVVEMADPAEVDRLLDAAAYRALVEEA